MTPDHQLHGLCEGCGCQIGHVAARGSGHCRPCYKRQFKLLRRGLPKQDQMQNCSGCGVVITKRKSGKCRSCYSTTFLSDAQNRAKAIARRKSWYESNKEYSAQKQRLYFLRPENRFARYKTDAMRRGYRFEISLDQYVSITSHGCAYCGTTGSAIGLDRMDTSGDYVIDNVVGCCWPCNKIKCDQLTFEEMKIAMTAILNFRNESRCL